MSKNSNRNRAAQTATETANAYEQPTGDTAPVQFPKVDTPPEKFEPTNKPEDTQGDQGETSDLADKIAAITSEHRSVNFMDNSEKPATTTIAEAVATAVAPAEPVVIAKQTILPPSIPVDPYQLPLSCSAGSRLTVQELREYVEKMSSRVRMPAAEGGQVQSGLYHILIQAINTRAEDFDATFGTVMRVIRDNLPTVFSMENMHRYTPYATLPSKSMAHFRYLLSVLTGLADPSLRNETARQTSLEKAFRSMNIKEEARQRVLNFFNF